MGASGYLCEKRFLERLWWMKASVYVCMCRANRDFFKLCMMYECICLCMYVSHVQKSSECMWCMCVCIFVCMCRANKAFTSVCKVWVYLFMYLCVTAVSSCIDISMYVFVCTCIVMYPSMFYAHLCLCTLLW